jgi:ABC-type branched-subunit amino acid transport system permease subunit
MTHTNGTLARLRRERDQALSLARSRFAGAGHYVKILDNDIKALTTTHPVLALGCATAVGAMAGFLLGGRPLRHLAKMTARAMVKPLASGIVQHLLQAPDGESHDSVEN